MKNAYFLLCSILLLASCTSSRYTYQDGVEDDDIYYSSNDADYEYDNYVTESSPSNYDYVEPEKVDYYEDDYYSEDYESDDYNSDEYYSDGYNSGGDTYITNNYGNQGNQWGYSPWRSRFFSPYYGCSPYNLGWTGSNVFLSYDPFFGWSYGMNFNYPFGGFYTASPWGASHYWGYYYGYSAWGWCDPFYSYYNPYSFYNPYYGFGYAGYGYGGFGNDYFGNGGNDFHYGHITPISTGSGVNSGYTENTIFEPVRDKPISQVFADRPQENIALVTERPSGISNKRPAEVGDNTTEAVRPTAEKNPTARPGGSTVPETSRIPDVVASTDNDLTDFRPARVEDDFNWRAPSRETRPAVERPAHQNSREIGREDGVAASRGDSPFSRDDSWKRPQTRPSERPARTEGQRPQRENPSHREQRPRNDYNPGRNDRGGNNTTAPRNNGQGREIQRQDNNRGNHNPGNSNGSARPQNKPSIKPSNSGRSGSSRSSSSSSSRSSSSSKSSGSSRSSSSKSSSKSSSGGSRRR